jgi:signal peptidase II
VSTRRLAVAVASAAVVVDQATKVWAVAVLDDGPIQIFGDVLRLRLTRNTGAAFSSLQGLGPLIGIAAVGVVGLIFVMLRHVPRRFEVVGLGLVLGGAIGNLLDRIFRGDGFLDGAVVDWIDPSFFPAFNGADSAITIGVAVLLFGALRPVGDA